MSEQRLVDFVDAVVQWLDSAEIVVERGKKFLHAMEAPNIWTPEKVIWTEVTGPSGIYRRSGATKNRGNKDFAAMVGDINAHGGTLNRNGEFFWLFDRTKVVIVGRKRK